MARVSTYVFIDLETTGLPKFEYNKTRITELSMVVVSRRHVLETTPGAAPRVLDKLTMCFNPRRMIHPESTKTSGLCNDLLEHQTDFNIHVFNIINSFLQCHEKPVCLIAQNGHSFDFPILKNHFEKLGVSLSDDILCADSLHAFHDIFEIVKRKANDVDVTVVDNISCDVKRDESFGANTKEDQTSVQAEAKSIAKSNGQNCNGNNEQLESPGEITGALLEDNIKVLNSQALMQKQNETTPIQKQENPKPSNKKSTVKRKLYWGDNEKPTVSYKLKNVYERVLGRPAIEAHRAENDCVMTMETSVSIAKDFVEWIDKHQNHCKFNDVKAMEVGVPLH